MQVISVKLRNFMRHVSTDLVLPPNGLVLVTGQNGHGKSALVEAIPAAGWNETLRGTPWYKKDHPSSVTMDFKHNTGTYTVQRQYTRSASHKLKLVGDSREFDSATKAQEMLNTLIGSYDVWRRTHVFSSSDDAHLSRSTDGQRKRFMETILGLDRFDTALKTCRDDLKTLNSRLGQTRAEYTSYDTKQQYEKNRLDEAKRSISSINLPIEPTSASTDINTVNNLRRVMQTWNNTIRELEQAQAGHKTELRHINETLTQLGAAACPLCRHPISSTLRQELSVAVARAQSLLKESQQEAEQTLPIIEAMITESRSDVDCVLQERARNDEAVKNFNRLIAERTRQERIIEEATAANAKYLRSRAELRGTVAELECEVAVIEACNKILGLRGMRANITGGALSGLESIASDWLGRFTAPGEEQMSLAINPYTELKRGGTSDEWSINVVGAGGGFGYMGASAGQRRRIDIALMFASLQVAQAALGVAAGTVFFDEVFDGLDEVGICAVSDALSDLGSDRVVVVISHSEALVEALQPVMHISIHNGEVTLQ